MSHRWLRIIGVLWILFMLSGCTNGIAPALYQDGVDEGTEDSSALLQEPLDYVKAYADKIQEYEKDAADLEYDLVYLDEDDIPELVVEKTGYDVSVYTYASGTLHTIMERWPYGAMGNAGYEYIPQKNVIRNYNADLAGAILYVSYYRVNEVHKLESYYEETLSSWAFRDLNHNYAMDEDEPFEDERSYHYGDQEITAEEYETYLISGDYQWLQGEKDASEMLSELQAMEF